MTEGNEERIIDYKRGDITGDGVKDYVYIVSSLYNKGLNKHYLVLKEGSSNKVLRYALEDNNYNFQVNLEHYRDKDKLDILVRSIGECFGGCVSGKIFTYEGGELKEIFNTENFFKENKISAIYKDDYKVEILNFERNKKYLVDIKDNFKYYLDFVYTKDGKVREGKERINISGVWGCNSYYAMGSKTASLSIVQQVIGQATTDILCLIESTLNWNGEKFFISDEMVNLKGNFINKGSRLEYIESNFRNKEKINKEYEKYPWYFLSCENFLRGNKIEALKYANMSLILEEEPFNSEAFYFREYIKEALKEENKE